jgi:hypothetical protein
MTSYDGPGKLGIHLSASIAYRFALLAPDMIFCRKRCAPGETLCAGQVGLCHRRYQAPGRPMRSSHP